MHREGNNQQNKKATYWMGEDICKQYIQQGVNIQKIQRTQISKKKNKNPDLKISRGSE